MNDYIHADPDGPTGKLIAAYEKLGAENVHLRARLALAEKVVEAADRVSDEIFGDERYDVAMEDLCDALAALRAYDAH